KCETKAKSAAVGPYVEMARTLKAQLDKAPGDQELVLGELAGLPDPGPKSASVDEFISDVPKDLACGVKVWTQHGYIGGVNPVDDVERALKRKGCGKPALWITETGVGAPHTGGKPRKAHAAQVARVAGRGVQAAARAARAVVPRRSRDRRVPVHVPRGRPVPDRARQDRPLGLLPGACRMAGLGRPGTPAGDRPGAGRALLNLK